MIYNDKICQDIFHEWKGAIGGGQDVIFKYILVNKTHGGNNFKKKKPNKIEGCLMYTTYFPNELSCM
jgi:hypothetical protein